MHGCNMIIGRPVFERVGLFDVRLGAGTALRSAEDIDLLYRAFKAGVPISYDPDLVVFHHHGRTSLAEVDKLMHDYVVGYGAFAMKHLLDGDLGPTKDCWWKLRAAFRQRRQRQFGFSPLINKSAAVIGAAKFIAQIR